MAGFDSTSGKSPAFQFYPSDFMGDGKQAGMSLQECGAYIRLLCVCWNDGSIPDDVERISHIIGANKAITKKLWPAVRACFKEKNGRLIHKRLEEERRKQVEYRRRQSDASRKRWDKPRLSHGSPSAQPVDMPKASSSVFNLQSSDFSHKEPAPPARDWFTECQERHGGRCGGQVSHSTTMLLERERAKAVMS